MQPDAVLLAASKEAALAAYAPYSRFRVGSAVRSNGKIYTGCNIENASYGLTICAERVAIFKAVADGAPKLEAIALSCVDAPVEGNLASLMPCGACRQVLAEFASIELPVYVDGAGRYLLGDLLPTAFRLR